jgi:dihydropteroate synthase
MKTPETRKMTGNGAPGIKWRCRDHVLDCDGRVIVMGILNVTPDSFSDGNRYFGLDRAIARGLEMIDQGATIIDVGGESTRPGAAPVDAADETARVVPVIEGIFEGIRARGLDDGVVVSVDTTKAAVAQRSIAAGAAIINDVSALSSDPDMPSVAAESGAGVVLMHMRGNPRVMQDDPRYEDVVSEVRDYLSDRVEALAKGGIERDRLSVDPGIGFGKTVAHNVDLLRGLGSLVDFGRPVVVGLSRKSFLGMLTGREVDDRLAGSLSALVFCMMKGAHVMRVHDVTESIDAAAVAGRLLGGMA